MLKHLGNTSITSGVLQNLTLSNGVSFVTLTAPPTGIYILAFPPDLGTSGQVLTTNGAGRTSWTTVSGGGGGTVTSVAATVPTFLQVTGSPITSFGTLDITYSGIPLPTTSGGTGLTTVGANGSFLQIQSGAPAWTTPSFAAGTVTSVSASVPSFLSVLVTSPNITPSIAITYSGTALPTTSGGTGLTVIGANNTFLTSNGTVASWLSSSGTGDVVRVTSATMTTPAVTSTVAGTPALAVTNSSTGVPGLIQQMAASTSVGQFTYSRFGISVSAGNYSQERFNYAGSNSPLNSHESRITTNSRFLMTNDDTAPFQFVNPSGPVAIGSGGLTIATPLPTASGGTGLSTVGYYVRCSNKLEQQTKF